MKAVRIKRHKALWCVVPKCASTSIKLALIRYYDLDWSGKIHKCPLPYVHDHYIAHYRDWWSFAIVRDPRDRLLSTFSDTTLLPQLSRHGLTRSTSWPAFLERVCAMGDAGLNGHLLPQARHLEVDGELWPDLIVKIEHLAEMWPEIQKRTGLGPIPHERITPHGPWREHYTAEQYRMVTDRFIDDCEAFGYPT